MRSDPALERILFGSGGLLEGAVGRVEADLAILAAAANDVICYLRLAAVTFARQGQMVALRWRDIDLDPATVRFTTALARDLPPGLS